MPGFPSALRAGRGDAGRERRGRDGGLIRHATRLGDVLAGHVEPGDAVAIVDAGPIGLVAVMTARLLTPGLIIVLDIADAAATDALKVVLRGPPVNLSEGERALAAAR